MAVVVISVFDKGNGISCDGCDDDDGGDGGGVCGDGDEDDGGDGGGVWHEVRRTQLAHLPHSQPQRALRESCSWRSRCLGCC